MDQDTNVDNLAIEHLVDHPGSNEEKDKEKRKDEEEKLEYLDTWLKHLRM